MFVFSTTSIPKNWDDFFPYQTVTNLIGALFLQLVPLWNVFLMSSKELVDRCVIGMFLVCWNYVYISLVSFYFPNALPQPSPLAIGKFIQQSPSMDKVTKIEILGVIKKVSIICNFPDKVFEFLLRLRTFVFESGNHFFDVVDWVVEAIFCRWCFPSNRRQFSHTAALPFFALISKTLEVFFILFVAVFELI